MKIHLNGEDVEYTGVPRLADLIKEFAPDCRVAALVNNQVVPTSAHTEFELHPDDRAELLTFAGGG